ncbi:MAG TPA: hypothetical protein VF329_15675 [Gammaproteobacteria bacterium]
MQFLVPGILCALGAAALASLVPHHPSRYVLLGGGFIAAAALLGPDRVPGAGWIGTAIAIVALAALIRPSWSVALVAAGGACAGLWASVLRAQGLPLAAALLVAALPPLVAAFLAARRPQFAPPSLRDEALALIAVLGLCVAAAGPILTGWQSAAALKAVPLEAGAGGRAAAPVLLLAAAFLFLGGVYSLWKRR